MIQLLITFLLTFIGTTEVGYTEGASLISNTNSLSLVQNGRKYTAIRDGLYRDENGKLCFRTKDWSKEDLPSDRYIYVVYSQRFGTNGIQEMTLVIDPDSFKAIGASYYKDKDNIYYFKEMSDGGTLALVDDADLKSTY